jgi:hypothetical protein
VRFENIHGLEDDEVKRSHHAPDRESPARQRAQPAHVAGEDSEIDQILADSFPASDAPPWTLGVTAPRKEGRTRARARRQRATRP